MDWSCNFAFYDIAPVRNTQECNTPPSKLFHYFFGKMQLDYSDNCILA